MTPQWHDGCSPSEAYSVQTWGDGEGSHDNGNGEGWGHEEEPSGDGEVEK